MGVPLGGYMLLKALKSRTVWTIAVMFALGGVQAIQPVLPTDAFVAIQGALSLLATYFKLSPSQTY